jgi:hypothetical protein
MNLTLLEFTFGMAAGVAPPHLGIWDYASVISPVRTPQNPQVLWRLVI